MAATTALHIPSLTLGRRLFLARDDAGLTQAEMAERIGVSKRSVVNYENDNTEPRRPVLLSWAMATKVPVEWLLTGVVEYDEDGTPIIHALPRYVQLTLSVGGLKRTA